MAAGGNLAAIQLPVELASAAGGSLSFHGDVADCGGGTRGAALGDGAQGMEERAAGYAFFSHCWQHSAVVGASRRLCDNSLAFAPVVVQLADLGPLEPTPVHINRRSPSNAGQFCRFPSGNAIPSGRLAKTVLGLVVGGNFGGNQRNCTLGDGDRSCIHDRQPEFPWGISRCLDCVGRGFVGQTRCDHLRSAAGGNEFLPIAWGVAWLRCHGVALALLGELG